MYVLFSLSTLLFFGVGCEQRPELGKSVEFASEKTKEISVEELVNTEVQTETKTSENVASKNSEEEVQSQTSDKKESDKESDKESNFFEEDSFQLDSSEMGGDTPSKSTTDITKTIVIDNVVDANQTSSLIKSDSWPIQVVGILDSVPKRATLRRSNGSEISVQAGHVLGEERLVVLAIGKNHVSLAKIHPQGDMTTIQQIDLQPLY